MVPNWFDHALVLSCAVLLPIRGATIGYRRLASIGDDATTARMRFYRQSLLLHAAILALTLIAWGVPHREWSELGLAVPDPWRALAALAAVFVGLWLHYRQGRAGQRSRNVPSVQAARLGRLAPLMPRTRTELDAFIALLLLAAASEEILFRGFLTSYLQSYVPLLAAATLSVLVFASGHLYQGWKGVMQTGVIGAICMIFYLATGSLWPSIVLHGGLNFISAHIGHAIVRASPRS